MSKEIEKCVNTLVTLIDNGDENDKSNMNTRFCLGYVYNILPCGFDDVQYRKALHILANTYMRAPEEFSQENMYVEEDKKQEFATAMNNGEIDELTWFIKTIGNNKLDYSIKTASFIRDSFKDTTLYKMVCGFIYDAFDKMCDYNDADWDDDMKTWYEDYVNSIMYMLNTEDDIKAFKKAWLERDMNIDCFLDICNDQSWDALDDWLE